MYFNLTALSCVTGWDDSAELVGITEVSPSRGSAGHNEAKSICFRLQTWVRTGAVFFAVVLLDMTEWAQHLSARENCLHLTHPHMHAASS